MFLFGELSFTALAMIILFAFVYPKDSPEWTVWFSLIICLAMGSGTGYLTQKYARAGVLLIGLWIGGLLGAFIYASSVSKLENQNPLIALWLTLLVTTIIIGYLS